MPCRQIERYWDRLSRIIWLFPNRSIRWWLWIHLSPQSFMASKIFLSPRPTNDKKLLSALRKAGKFVYLPDKGNLGDSLIAKATYDFFDKYHLKYTIRPVQKDDVLVYGGGGIWIRGLYNTSEIIEQMKIAKRVIILPSTIYDCPKLIKILNEKFIIFTRERQSYNYLKSLKTKATILLDEDMAFRLTDIGGKCKITPDLYTWQERIWPQIHQFGKTAYFFRKDQERKSANKNLPSFDLSGTCYSYWKNKKQTSFACFSLFHIINQFDTIRTDRLHIAIAGALLGKKVELWDNSYGKCSAVWKHSLKKFKHVTFKNENQKINKK